MDAKYVSLLCKVEDRAVKAALAEIIKEMERLQNIVKSQKTA